jgi:SAM-dependent methyltransferase
MTDTLHGERLLYGALNCPVQAAIPLSARRVLDLGCGTGALGRDVKSRQPAEVVGVTYSEAEAALAEEHLDSVLVQDLNAFEPDGLGQFDCVVCSHVLEHLCWPDQLLHSIQSLLAPGGRLIVALPNALAWRQRLAFAFGRFRYTDGGLMDRTHFRFFDWHTARSLVSGAGYRVISARGDGVLPLARFVPVLGRYLNRVAVRLAPGLFSWQFVIVAESSVA